METDQSDKVIEPRLASIQPPPNSQEVVVTGTVSVIPPHEEWHHSADWWVAGGTLVLALVTAILALFTWKLWSVTFQMFCGAERTATLQLRAYVNHESGELSDEAFSNSVENVKIQLGRDMAMRVKILVKNSGKTPAFNLTGEFNYAVVPVLDVMNYRGGGLPSSFSKAVPAGVRTTVGPGSECEFGCTTRSITVFEREKLHAGELAIFIHGRVDYVDVFGKKHTSKFRVKSGQGRGFLEGRIGPTNFDNESD